jgi:trigger factor
LHVTIKDARERKPPALDDELAKDTGEAQTLDELKAKVREQLLADDNRRIEAELEAQLSKKIVEANPFPIAGALVDRHAEALLARRRAQLMMLGIDIEADGQFDLAKAKEAVKGDAEEQARLTVLLQAIAEREGIGVDDADVQKHIAALAAARRESAHKLRAELERAEQMPQIRAHILEKKTLGKLLEQAKIEERDEERLIVTPAEAAGQNLIVTPEQAMAEAQGQARVSKRKPR